MDDTRFYLPFPTGVNHIEDDFGGNVFDRCLPFPRSYEGLIMSALKVLARPETYRSTLTGDLQYAVQQGHDILAAATDYPGCGSPSQGILGITNCGLWADARLVGYPAEKTSRYAFTSLYYDANGDPVNACTRWYVIAPGWINPGVQWEINLYTRVPGRIYQVRWRDCNNVDHLTNDVLAGQFLQIAIPAAKSVYLDFINTDILFGYLDLIGDIQCGDI